MSNQCILPVKKYFKQDGNEIALGDWIVLVDIKQEPVTKYFHKVIEIRERDSGTIKIMHQCGFPLYLDFAKYQYFFIVIRDGSDAAYFIDDCYYDYDDPLSTLGFCPSCVTGIEAKQKELLLKDLKGE